MLNHGRKYITDDGDVIGITKFDESAPEEQVMKEYEFSVENVIAKAKALLNQNIIYGYYDHTFRNHKYA
ncbi:MAG: hypothetical protein M3Z26_10485 [Bacteroidota bacterium]|nr:hypothetical protein [Bacteroidota bacterium]